MPEPTFLALITADKVITEEKNHKKTIVGTFTNFYSQRFPAKFPPWFIYVAITNLDGDYNFSINVAQDESDYVVFSAGGKLSVKDPQAVPEIAIPVPDAQFPEPGKYNVIFKLNNHTIANRVLNLVQPHQAGGA